GDLVTSHPLAGRDVAVAREPVRARRVGGGGADEVVVAVPQLDRAAADPGLAALAQAVAVDVVVDEAGDDRRDVAVLELLQPEGGLPAGPGAPCQRVEHISSILVSESGGRLRPPVPAAPAGRARVVTRRRAEPGSPPSGWPPRRSIAELHPHRDA